jgi:hypothetical protein
LFAFERDSNAGTRHQSGEAVARQNFPQKILVEAESLGTTYTINEQKKHKKFISTLKETLHIVSFGNFDHNMMLWIRYVQKRFFAKKIFNFSQK